MHCSVSLPHPLLQQGRKIIKGLGNGGGNQKKILSKGIKVDSIIWVVLKDDVSLLELKFILIDPENYHVFIR